MPIITRTLESIQQTTGGIFAAWLCIDAKGREWRRSRARFADETAALAAANAFDWTLQLKDRDFQDLLAWVQAKNDSDAFDFTDMDLTLLEGEERLLVYFASNEGAEAITLAWWIEAMNPPTFNAIRDRVGYDNATGSRIQDRAIAMVAAEASFDVVEETP